MGWFDSLLGPDRGPGLLSAESSEESAPTNPQVLTFERKIAQAYQRLDSAAGLEIAPIDISTGAPFLEIPVRAEQVPQPNLASSINQGVPLALQIPGEALVLRKVGTPPGARVIVEVGGRIHTMIPGTRITAPFKNINLVRRQYFLTSDFSFPGQVNQGFLNFLVEKEKGIHYHEPDYRPNVPPWFPSIDINGAWSKGNDATVWNLTGSGQQWSMSTSGCSRIRIYIADKNYPGASASGLVNGDVLTFSFIENPWIYGNESAINGIGAVFSSVPAPLTYNTSGGSTKTIDFDMSVLPETFNFTITNSLGHSQYMAIIGIPG